MRQIVYAWCDISFTIPSENFGNQIIWNNSHIHINDNLVMYHQLFDKKVIYICDIFDHDGIPLTFQRFKLNFHINYFPFTLYWDLICGIP